jgi:high-affinity iron transporter
VLLETDHRPGLFSKAIWFLQNHQWSKIIGGDAAETGSGPGSYNIRQSVWHVNCCNPEINGGGGWGVFNSLFGWTNSATYGSVISYNMYWLAVIVAFGCMQFYERKGHWPLMKAKAKKDYEDSEFEKRSSEGGSDGVVPGDVVKEGQGGQTSSTVREIQV